MYELRNIKRSLDKVYFTCDLPEYEKKVIEAAARFEAALFDVEYNPDFINDKSWTASDMLLRLAEQFEDMTPRQEEE